MKLIRVTLRVRNQQDALLFYTEKLGFVKRAEFPYGQGQHWITVSPSAEDDVEIVLQPPEWFDAEEREQHLQYAGHNPPLVFQVENCRATYEQFQSNNVQFSVPPSERPYGIEADAMDMDGNLLVFLQLPGSMKD
jgi:catechol 2,3-dioxygenase-like lactoylglutathione lyase family enzyme